MKLNYIIAAFISCTMFAGCSDDDYVSNDPNADPGAPYYSDVVDQKQPYSINFRPSDGWVGDPMPFYDNGKFHVFYLQDARDGAATFHPWYKAVTGDLITYEDSGEMIPCGEDNSQEDALGTGGLIKRNGKYYAYYTAHNSNLDPKEKIYLATSTDLYNWEKQPEFELVGYGYNWNDFRDPFLMEGEDGTCRMLISTRDYTEGPEHGIIAEYSSTDMLNWTKEEPFYRDRNSTMPECPDVFVMGDYQYLIYSDIDDRMVHYRYRNVGSKDWKEVTYSPLDGVAYYAAKTASDGTNRYLFGWCPTRTGYNDTSDYSWGGSLVVHQLTQNADGTLNVVVPATINNKFNSPVALNALLLNNAQGQNGTFTLHSSNEKASALFDRQKGAYKITATITASTATKFGFEFGAGGTRTRIHNLIFDLENKDLKLNYVANNESLTRTSTALVVPANKTFSVTMIIENSVCVVYVNNQIALTCRIYQMNNNPWGIFSENGEVVFSDLMLNR